jgi:hypothetical protein
MTRLAKRPKEMGPVQKVLWEHYESDPDRFSLTEMSKQAGMDHAYIQQFLHRGTPRELPERVRQRLARFLAIPEGRLRGQETGGNRREGTISEGELVPRDQAPPRLQNLLEPGLELWRVLGNSIAIGGFMIGDYVLVDTRSRRPGSYVVVTLHEGERQRNVLRLFLPPHLFVSVGNTSLEKAETIDGMNVLVRGAIIGRYADLE